MRDKVWDVGLADHICDRNGVFITDGVVKRTAIQQVKFWLNPVQGGQRRLRVQINCQHAVASEGKALSQMSRGSGFSRATLEVHHSDDLEVIARTTAWKVVARFPCSLFQKCPEVLDILSRVVSAIPRRDFR